MTLPRSSASPGQASVELVALLPLLAMIGLIVFSLVLAHTADEEAGQAAEAGALALMQGGDPHAAARDALPSAVRATATIAVEGRRVHVRVRPRLPLPAPLIASYLTGDARTDAGPATP
jgi:hypothetical protein